jgi:hypothetical protein
MKVIAHLLVWERVGLGEYFFVNFGEFLGSSAGSVLCGQTIAH